MWSTKSLLVNEKPDSEHGSALHAGVVVDYIETQTSMEQFHAGGR
jgi:hypothetical protein